MQIERTLCGPREPWISLQQIGEGKTIGERKTVHSTAFQFVYTAIYYASSGQSLSSNVALANILYVSHDGIQSTLTEIAILITGKKKFRIQTYFSYSD
jgi:hypothetical protein